MANIENQHYIKSQRIKASYTVPSLPPCIPHLKEEGRTPLYIDMKTMSTEVQSAKGCRDTCHVRMQTAGAERSSEMASAESPTLTHTDRFQTTTSRYKKVRLTWLKSFFLLCAGISPTTNEGVHKILEKSCN